MKVNQVNYNTPSFGMAFKTDMKDFVKADLTEVGKVARIVELAGERNLDKLSEGVDCNLLPKIEDGKIKFVSILALSQNSEGMINQLKELIKLIGSTAKAKFTGNMKDLVENLGSARLIRMEEFTPSTLLDAVAETSTNALKRFGKK